MPVTLDQILDSTRGALPRSAARRARARAEPRPTPRRRRRSRAALRRDDGGGHRRGEAALAVGRGHPRRSRSRRSARRAMRGTGRRRSRCSPTGRSSAARSSDLRAAAAVVRACRCSGRISSSTSSRSSRRAPPAPSAVLLIVRALPPGRLAALLAQRARRRPRRAGRGPHRRPSSTVALDAGADIVGVNSRDLDTFRIDTAAAWRLLASGPGRPRSRSRRAAWPQRPTSTRAADAGADAVLIGTALSAAADPAAAARPSSPRVRPRCDGR